MKDEFGKPIDADGVQKHRDDARADEKCGRRHVDIAKFEPTIARARARYAEIESLCHTSTVLAPQRCVQSLLVVSWK